MVLKENVSIREFISLSRSTGIVDGHVIFSTHIKGCILGLGRKAQQILNYLRFIVNDETV